jgi:hypothetical protein
VLALYRTLLWLRADQPALQTRTREHMQAEALGEHTLALRRSDATNPMGDTLLLLVHLSDNPLIVHLGSQEITLAPAGQRWAILFDSEAAAFGGSAPDPGEVAEVITELDLHGPRAVLLYVAGS